MTDQIQIENVKLPDNIGRMGIHPQKFALYLGLAVLSMTFAGLTSAYIVRKGAGDWVPFEMPQAFIVSAALILLSSITIFFSVRAFRRENINQYRALLTATLLLAIAFSISQLMGWRKLQEIGIYLAGNPSGSFVYVISFVHLAHVGVGLIFLIIAWIRSFTTFANPAQVIIYNTHPTKRVRIELLATYWHFVDLLWLYLLLFFLMS